MNRIELIVSGTPAARPRARSRVMQTSKGPVAVTYHPRPTRNPKKKDAKASNDFFEWIRLNTGAP